MFQVVVSRIFYFHPYLGRWSNLTNISNIFQWGWNHKPVLIECMFLPRKLGFLRWLLFFLKFSCSTGLGGPVGEVLSGTKPLDPRFMRLKTRGWWLLMDGSEIPQPTTERMVLKPCNQSLKGWINYQPQAVQDFSSINSSFNHFLLLSFDLHSLYTLPDFDLILPRYAMSHTFADIYPPQKKKKQFDPEKPHSVSSTLNPANKKSYCGWKKSQTTTWDV